jgi:hypothetical protein
MPVEDVAVHPSVKHTHPPAACHSTPLPKEGYFVLERNYTPDGRYHLEDRFIPHRMSLPCRQIGRKFNGAWVPLDECMGCKTLKDTEYIEKARLAIDREFVK